MIGTPISPADLHRPWAQRAVALGLECACPDCLRAAGVTPHGGCSAQHRVKLPPGLTAPEPVLDVVEDVAA